MNTLLYFHESLVRKLFFFELVKCRKFQNVGDIIFPLINENLNTFLTKICIL